MRSAWFVGGLSLLLFSAGCSCGSCGWGNCGRGYPATYQQAATPTPQYNMAGSYASTPPGATGAPVTTASATEPAPSGGTSTSLSSTDESVVR